MFAGDTKLVCKIIDVISHHIMMLQNDLNNIVHWSIKNNMELNGDKFEVLNYINKSLFLINEAFTGTHLQYNFPDYTMIEQSQNVRDLGVLPSNDCSWSHLGPNC